MTSVLPFLGYVSKRQHGIALNGICSRFEDTLPLCLHNSSPKLLSAAEICFNLFISPR